MEKESNDIDSRADKVAKFYQSGNLKAFYTLLPNKSGSGKSETKTIRIPFIKMPLPSNKFLLSNEALKKPASTNMRMRQMKNISLDLLNRAKPVTSHYRALYKTAFEAFKTCQEQDLHLFHLKKVYFEKAFSLKNFVGWKLPKPFIAKAQISLLVDYLKSQNYYEAMRHNITKLIIGEALQKEREKELQEQLEIQKKEQDRRNFHVGPKGLL